jgi:hypothetical protein
MFRMAAPCVSLLGMIVVVCANARCLLVLCQLTVIQLSQYIISLSSCAELRTRCLPPMQEAFELLSKKQLD